MGIVQITTEEYDKLLIDNYKSKQRVENLQEQVNKIRDLIQTENDKELDEIANGHYGALYTLPIDKVAKAIGIDWDAWKLRFEFAKESILEEIKQ